MISPLIELDNGAVAIIHLQEKNNLTEIKARVGFTRPGMRCLEYINLKNWELECMGTNDAVNKWLEHTYNQNISAIQQRIYFITQ